MSQLDTGRVPFGTRLAAAMDASGPLCLGIDPHPQLLADWDLPDTPVALERFSRTALEAAAGAGARPLVAALKPQVALYERHGSAGLAVLERLLAAAREAGVLTIADAKRGDIGSTMAGYAQAWLADGSPLAADAVTLSPYLGYGSLAPAIELAGATGRGVFVLALTSNPEGASVQHVGGPEASVARSITESAAADNARALAGAAGIPGAAGPDGSDGGRAPFGPVGLVVGATVADRAAALGIDLAGVRGALLAPGFGAQGASGPGMRAGFGAAWPAVLATSSRAILRQGPSVAGLRRGIEEARADLSA
ncbi:orotidine-5'-phosphate decarboxylase [Citricoccus sp. SGAir0253]|uniref:orotidine-5'-phosphate decarboxylase n=1 Tax=Citricoccus sp. SGAir0253 TaxID=2567881 RepID=UPI0010CCCDDD|nr:orotidine-5'-phosphate decarboxylase [Citricoccus sp. SGAir0253]QCU77925.1 orotidine-5'-phosphate decarboxylase [Citricoccus sp. SGAir0253]